MKFRIPLILIGAVSFAWLLDTTAYVMLFDSGSFLDAFIFDVSLHEMYQRIITILLIIVAVIIIARLTDSNLKIEKYLEESEGKFTSIFNHSNDAIIIHNLDGKIIEVNSKAVELFHYTKKEFLNKTISQLQPKSEVKKTKEAFVKIMKEGSIRYEIDFFKKTGDTFPAEVSSSSFKISNQKMIQKIIRDITERKQIECELIKEKEKAETADKLKSDFLAQISHEIRTPINAVLSFSSLIREKVEDTINDELLDDSFDIINKSGNRIIRTVDLILNMSELQSGGYKIKPRNINLCNGVLEQMVNEYKNRAHEKGLQFEVNCKLKEIYIFADYHAVNQIISNLLNNALKYTAKGKIELSLKQSSKHGIVEVKDSGIGISDEYLPKLYAPFSQEEQGYSRKFEGNGLGLSLVKQYCDLNNAQIEVESKRGEGSTFRIKFPSKQYSSAKC